MSKRQASEFTLWLGDFSSYVATMQAQEKAGHALEVGAYAEPDEDEDDKFQGYGYMTQQVGSTAVVSISGKLITQSNWLSRLFGMTGYDEISNAVAAASQAEGISQILLDVDSPGGSANGVEQAADMVAKVNADVMPVTAWTGGTMASAAYWIGSAAGNVYSTPMANVGSIGTIAIHQEITKMLKDEGINATVFRSGKYKALGNPYETLTEEAKEVIQGKIDSMSDHFISKVAENRGRTTDFIKANAAEGREFFGKDAIGVGLIDGLATFEEVVKLIDTDHNSPRADQTSGLYTGADTMLRKKVMTQEAQAAIAAGAPAEAALEEHGEELETQAAPQGEIPEGTETAAEGTQDGASEETTENEQETEEQEQAPAAAVESDALGQLVSKLSEVQTELAQAKVDLAQSVKQVEALQSTETGLKDIAATSINRMQIALGGSATDLSAFDSSTLLAQYESTQNQFLQRFPVGAKAEVKTEGDGHDRKTGRVVSFTQSAVANATKFNQREE